jgi:hypothetical protein
MPTEKTWPVQVSGKAHGIFSELKADTGKTLKRLVEEGAEARQILPKLIAAIEAGDAQPNKLGRLLAEAKAIL